MPKRHIFKSVRKQTKKYDFLSNSRQTLNVMFYLLWVIGRISQSVIHWKSFLFCICAGINTNKNLLDFRIFKKTWIWTLRKAHCSEELLVWYLHFCHLALTSFVWVKWTSGKLSTMHVHYQSSFTYSECALGIYMLRLFHETVSTCLFPYKYIVSH